MPDDSRRMRIARALADHEQAGLALDAHRYPPEKWLCCAEAVLAALERELTALPDGRLSRPERDRLELALIRRRRDAGQTWREIAVALGRNSPQVAHARFQRLVAREAEQERANRGEPS